jgi:hypothetical protein
MDRWNDGDRRNDGDRWNDDQTPPDGLPPYPGQPYPAQPYPGQQHPAQPYPAQSYPGQPYPGQPGQPVPGDDRLTARLPRYYTYGSDQMPPPYPDDEGYDDGGYDDEPPPRNRNRALIAAGVAVVLVLALIGTAWLLIRPGTPPTRQLADPSAGGPLVGGLTDSPTPTTAPTSAAATTTPPAPKPTPKKTTPRPRPTPTKKPPAAQKPPPPPSPVPSSPSCTKHPGPDASSSTVSTALANAGVQNYWQGVAPPSGSVPPLPAFSVEPRLMDAFAWTESSWQSTIISCDGGIGLMQLMTDNVAFLNQRFGFDPSLDVNTVDGNCQLGAAYIEWLTAYFGTYYFGSYDLMNATAAVGTGGVTVSLLDVVIAAYNVGPDAVEDTHGTADGSDDTLSIPNQSYVDKVKSAYATQPWP